LTDDIFFTSTVLLEKTAQFQAKRRNPNPFARSLRAVHAPPTFLTNTSTLPLDLNKVCVRRK